MKKIIYLIILTLLFSSCVSGDKKEIKENIESSIQINTGSIIKEEEPTRIDKLSEIGNTEKEILDSFYSNDDVKKEQIKKWLSNPKNKRNSDKGDIIEFLDYCETLIQLKTKEDVIRFMTKDGDRTDFNKIIENRDFKDFYKDYEKGLEGFKYKKINYSILYKFILENNYEKENIALYSVASILAFLNNDINYEKLKVELLKDKKNYNLLGIEYMQNFHLEGGCKSFYTRHGKYKGSGRISNTQ